MAADEMYAAVSPPPSRHDPSAGTAMKVHRSSHRLRRLCPILGALLVAGPSIAGQSRPPTRITVATWNIAWFGDGIRDGVLRGNQRGGRFLRQEADLERLRGVVSRLIDLDVEVVGLQEVENAAAVRRIFPEDGWDLFLSTRETDPEWSQRTAIVVRRAAGWRDTRPPALLVLATVLTVGYAGGAIVVGLMETDPGLGIGAGLGIAVGLLLLELTVTAAFFVFGRAAIIWFRPRFRVYSGLADYLRVMWIPIGGFAIRYVTIILLFAGFYGMLEHFSPGAFSAAGTGIVDWLFFSFFAALGQDFATVAPVSVAARGLVGLHLILSAGWVVVLFAAVMTSIGPKLERIARRHAEDDGDD